ncbi:MAG: hypothetical protein WC943_15560, partial [Elusimicrobiota bacterium]
MKRLAFAALSSVALAWSSLPALAKDPPQGAPSGQPLGAASAADEEGDVERAQKIHDLIWGKVEIPGDTGQFVGMVRTEIGRLSDKELQEELLVELGK